MHGTYDRRALEDRSDDPNYTSQNDGLLSSNAIGQLSHRQSADK